MTKCNNPSCPRKGTIKMVAECNTPNGYKKVSQMVCSMHCLELTDYGWKIEVEA